MKLVCFRSLSLSFSFLEATCTYCSACSQWVARFRRYNYVFRFNFSVFNFNALAPKQLRSEFPFHTMWVAFRLTFSTIALILFAFASKKQSTDTMYYYIRSRYVADSPKTRYSLIQTRVYRNNPTHERMGQKKNKTANRSIDGVCFVRWGFSYCVFFICVITRVL